MAQRLSSTGEGRDPDADTSGEVTVVSIDDLREGDSPRLGGLDDDHVRVLAECMAELPPILVQRGTGRVVDGLHRLAAARQLGYRSMRVRWFDGDVHAAFVRSVMANTSHGLPLSLAEREAAAARMLAARPEFSDRFVAKVAGISAGAVATIRRGTADAAASVRIGRDGRARPVNGADGRRAARDVIAEHPRASLREIARRAGIAMATARDVREKMRRGEDPIGSARRRPGPARRTGEAVRLSADLTVQLSTLRKDPALRFNDSGRELLRWLSAHADGLEKWHRLAGTVPPHSAYLLAEMAAGCAQEWSAFAEHLRRSINAA